MFDCQNLTLVKILRERNRLPLILYCTFEQVLTQGIEFYRYYEMRKNFFKPFPVNILPK